MWAVMSKKEKDVVNGSSEQGIVWLNDIG